MDKYEYKVRSEELKSLVASKQYAEAMKIADTIDWHRVKSVMMLTIVSDIYKINRRFEDSKEVLLLAYERHPGGRTIVYSLCELAIKMEEFVQAVEYYKEFTQMAPKDTGRYILQYKLYEAQEVSLEERIGVLEEFKKRDYREKWAYELAYLYHRIGLGTKCIEECDELILWFGEGKYVLKAMELKMLHEPLNPLQQEKYNLITGGKKPEDHHYLNEEDEKRIEADAEVYEDADNDELDIQVKTVDVSKYNTINLQKELADSMKELLHDHNEIPTESSILFGNQNFQEEVNEVFFEEGKTAEIPLPELQEELEQEPQESNEISNTSEEETVWKPETSHSGEENDKIEMKENKKDYLNFNFMSEDEFEKFLAQEYDGQISLVVPEAEIIEKQITGQMNIAEIMAEWEQTKKVNQEKRLEDVRKRVSEQTGQLFSEFDEATKSDLLAKLEQASKLEEENRILKETVAQKLIEEEEFLQTTEMPYIPEEAYTDKIEEPIANQMEEQTDMEDGFGEVEELEEISDTAMVEETEENQESTGVLNNNSSKEDNVEDSNGLRSLSEEEEAMFAPLLHSRKAKKQLLEALDAISLASYTGNIIISGEEGSGTIELAKNLIKDIQMTDNNFSGKVARITGDVLNRKNIQATFSKLDNGALIVERANDLTPETLAKILKALDQGNKGIIVVLEDTPKQIEELLGKNDTISKQFNARICVPQLNNDALVAYAKEYSLEKEYVIDDLGVLALYTRIAEMQTCDYVVNTADVRDLVDEAIHHANKKSVSHFVDLLFGKRYDEEDMIILREKDFINY